MVIISGNHDLTSAETYELTRVTWGSVFGLPRFAFVTGLVFTLGNDCMSRDAQWVQAVYRSGEQEPAVKARVILDHNSLLRSTTQLKSDVMLIDDGHEK